MVKPVLTKGEFRALQSVLTCFVPSEIVRLHAMEGGWHSDWHQLNGMPLDTIIRALYIGYEVEE